MMTINLGSAQNIRANDSIMGISVAQRLVVLFSALILVCGFSVSGFAANGATDQAQVNAAPVVITGITVEDDAVLVKVQGPVKYSLQKTSDPLLVALVIEGASIGQFKDKIMSKSRGIVEVSPAQIEAPSLAARLDIMLQSKSEVKAELKGDILRVAVDRIAHVRSSAQTASSAKRGEAQDVRELLAEKRTADVESAPARYGGAREITEIFFERDKNLVELVIKANGKLGEPAVYQVDGSVILEIPGVRSTAAIPSKMVYPVKDIAVKTENEKLRIVVRAQTGVQSDVYILDDELLVDFSVTDGASRRTASEKGESTSMSKIANGGKLISLDFQDADIVPIIRLLGDVSGYNMVIHPDVKGKITMKLMNVPWTQALEIIVKTFNLEKVIEGNIIRIATVKAFQEEKKSSAENKELFSKAEDIVTKVFTVNHASVITVKEKTGSGSEREIVGVKDLIEKGKILSPRGSVSADLRTRSLIVKDTQKNIDEVQKLLDMLDKPTRQVLIEARIVEIKKENVSSLGVEWGLTGKASGVLSKGDSFTTSGSGSQNATYGGIASPLFNMPAMSSLSSLPQTGAVTFGYLTADKLFGLDLRLTAMGNTNNLKILASPKVLTLDNQEAIIKQGQKIPVTTQTVSQGTVTYTTTYIEATLKLTVTPQISPDGAILMRVDLVRDEPNEKTDILGNPYIDIRLASTKVVLNNGETLVIGGIINNRDTTTGSNVPGVSKIPVLGSLFRRDTDEISHLEMLIFLTPRLMEETKR
jgi:type IV pilus assembly protein PilQ